MKKPTQSVRPGHVTAETWETMNAQERDWAFDEDGRYSGRPAHQREPALFHGCPQCPPSRGPDDVCHAGKSHRAVCHAHRTTWFLGANLLSSWQHETEAEQRARYREIEGYTFVDTVHGAID